MVQDTDFRYAVYRLDVLMSDDLAIMNQLVARIVDHMEIPDPPTRAYPPPLRRT